MYTEQEKQAFSERLKAALAAAAPKIHTASDVATQFNLRHTKKPVSNQAVHKWLTGQAFPQIYNLETLANWLNVSTNWLRTGYDTVDDQPELTDLEYMLLERFTVLSEQQKKLLIELIDQLKATG